MIPSVDEAMLTFCCVVSVPLPAASLLTKSHSAPLKSVPLLVTVACKVCSVPAFVEPMMWMSVADSLGCGT